MTLTEAKTIADRPGDFSRTELAEARLRLADTQRNGGVRNSERATQRLNRRLERLDNELEALANQDEARKL